MSDWDIIKHPHLTEKSVGMVDEENTLVFIVDDRANKPTIRNAVEDLFEVDVERVNTQINQSGDKKAYVKLTPDHEALDVATQLGML
jgi:ribosomal protein uL23